MLVNGLFDLDVSRLSRAECADILARTKALEGRLLARLLTEDASAASGNASESDQLLTVEQAAVMLAVSKPWLYRRAKRLELAVKLADGTLRFSQNQIQKLIREQRLTANNVARRLTKVVAR